MRRRCFPLQLRRQLRQQRSLHHIRPRCRGLVALLAMLYMVRDACVPYSVLFLLSWKDRQAKWTVPLTCNRLT
jgi:hypothetical protein